MKYVDFVNLFVEKLNEGGWTTYGSISKVPDFKQTTVFVMLNNLQSILSMPAGSVYSREGTLDLIILTPYTAGENDTNVRTEQIYNTLDDMVDYIIKTKELSQYINTDIIQIQVFASMDNKGYVESRISFNFII